MRSNAGMVNRQGDVDLHFEQACAPAHTLAWLGLAWLGLKWAVNLAAVFIDEGSDSPSLWWLIYCCLGRYVDWCADRGRRAVR